MLQDRSFTSDGEVAYDHDGHRGAVGKVMLVNGAPWPVLDVAARKYRFRIVNASNAMPVRLALSTQQPLLQIATDQGLLPSPVTLSRAGFPVSRVKPSAVEHSRTSLSTYHRP